MSFVTCQEPIPDHPKNQAGDFNLYFSSISSVQNCSQIQVTCINTDALLYFNEPKQNVEFTFGSDFIFVNAQFDPSFH